MSTNYNTTSVNPSTVYNGGNLNEIKEEDILNNPTALRMLINELNGHKAELKEKNEMSKGILAENEYLKTSPFVALWFGIISLLGSGVMAIGLNLTNNPEDATFGWILFAISLAIIILGGSGPVLFPFARDYLKRKFQSKNPTNN